MFSTSNATTAPRYHYDPKGRRVAKTTGQGAQQTTTWYVYAEEGLIAEINEQGQTQKSYGWEPDSPWGTKILWQADHGSAATKTYHYIHSDHLGTPQIATDKNGNQTWAQVSEAFGKATISANASTEINIRFPGQYYDKETGTHYNFHRDYDPSTGRYLQSDPIGLRGGINMFSYTNNSPINFFDELGLKARMCCRAIPATLNIAYHCFIDIQDNDPSECPTCPPVTGRGSTSLHGPCGLGSGDCDRRGGRFLLVGQELGPSITQLNRYVVAGTQIVKSMSVLLPPHAHMSKTQSMGYGGEIVTPLLFMLLDLVGLQAFHQLLIQGKMMALQGPPIHFQTREINGEKNYLPRKYYSFKRLCIHCWAARG